MADSAKEINRELGQQAQKTDKAVKNAVPAHAPETATTRDNTPSVERPGHETNHPDRPKV